MAVNVQQTGSGDPCEGKSHRWGVCYNSVNPTTDQGQAYGIATSNRGVLGAQYSFQELQSTACAENNCDNDCGPTYCRGNSTSGGGTTVELNEFDDIQVVEQTGLQTTKNFCCAPYTQFTIETQTKSVVGPRSGVYDPNNFETPQGYELPGSYSNNIYRYSDGQECDYGTNIVECNEKVKIIIGCTDPKALNYNPEANQPSKCEYPTIGCKDPEATNYDADADENCENFSCCQYEDQLRDPIDCGNAVEQSKLEVKINTIDGEIQFLQNQRAQITDEQNNGFIPNTNSGYDSYLPYSNLNADIQVANTNEIFEQQTNEAVYRRYTSLNIEGVETDFDSFGGNPDFSDSTKWIPVVDTNGVVSFVLNDVYNDGDDTLTLSHNSQETAGANFYKEFCIAKGYTFDFFYTDAETGTQIPFTPDTNNTYQPQGITTQKCVDTNYITCAEVANVKMVFASNEWSGFYLPKDDGDTDVEISMDVMVKFNADTLLNECTEGDTCGLPYVDVNSKYDTACQNYVVFVDNQETINNLTQTKNASITLDSETSQGKWIYNSESITLWQTPGLQNEPNVECCELGMGGEVVSSNQYLSNGNTLNFDDLNIVETSEVYTDRQDYLQIEKNYKEILSQVKWCGVQYYEYVYRGCESNYAELITTQTICSITPPDDCLAYTTLLQDYEVMINQLALVDDSLTICVNEYNFLIQEIEDIEREIVIKDKERGAKKTELERIQTLHKQQSASCSKELENLRITKKVKETLLSNEQSKDKPNFLTINSLQTEINNLEIEIEDKELECFQITRNHKITIENINADIDELDKCIEGLEAYKKQLKVSLESKECCISLQKVVNKFESDVKESVYNDVLKKTIDCYDNWKDTVLKSYEEYIAEKSNSGNVLNFMENTIINVSLEVDNSIGQQENNRVTKYNTLPSYTSALNPVWKFDPTGGYTGVLLEGSDSSINIVKDSVNSQLISNGGSANNKIFEPQWQKIKFTLNEQQCNQLRLCYPDKQFFIGLSIVNENNCETTLLVDNIQINTDVNEITRVYSANNCPSFDLSCVIDDKKSWVFSDGGVTTKYIVSNNSCNPSPTDEKILTFSKPQERYRDNLEYRYTDYSVNHSKLVLNSKETSFRIDPANAIECDVYNFWQEIDCDNCNTLFSCATDTTLTYTNPTGGTLPLSGASCSSFDCDDILSDIKIGYATWVDRLDIELNDSTLIWNMSFSVMNNTKDKPKGSQRVSDESYTNDLFKIQNINKYDVSYFLPKSLGVGFDIQKSDCNSDIIEIKKYNEDIYTLISEEADGTLGFYSYTADTNDICELTSFVDEQCCNSVSDYLDNTFKINKPNYGWVDGDCRWKESDSIEDNCDNDCSYYGTILKQSNVIIPGITTSGETTLEEKFGLDSSTDIFVFYDATSNSLSNIRIQSAHIYRWWVHYIQGGVLVDIPEGERYTGKLRQYAVVGAKKNGDNLSRDPQGERWLAWASYPWTGRFLSVDDGDNTTNHGLIAFEEHPSTSSAVCRGGFKKNKWQKGGDSDYNNWSRSYTGVTIWDDETDPNPSGEVKSVLEILYEQQADGRWKDPITGDIYNDNDPYLIKEIPGIHRSDEPVYVNGKEYTTGGVAPELIDEGYMSEKGIFNSLPVNYKLTDPNEINRERVFMISMIDEAETFYHPTDTSGGADLNGDPSHDFYIGGNATSGFTQTYVDDFNKFIKIYQDGILGSGYTYFRGYNYSTLGGLSSSWPSTIDLTRCRALFSLHSYAAIQGEVVAPIDFEEYIYSSSGGTLSAITHSNPYSALTATTLDGQNKAGLKHFGWAENHQVGIGNKFTPSQIPLDVSGLTETDSVLQYTIGPSGTTGPLLSATCTDVPICINPLDYLDKEPNEVNIKPNFDEMVLSNLIDVKSRQVISDYPMLRLFYNQYLNANGCGASITNRLDYNTTFEVMDLIGDYWTDIIEQVVPATTIWDGCQNSGKVYRNTIFDQNKYNYRRYAINYYGGECGINEITRESIAVNSVSKIDLTEYCLSGECLGEDMIALNSEIKSLEIRAKFLANEINKITKILEQNANQGAA